MHWATPKPPNNIWVNFDRKSTKPFPSHDLLKTIHPDDIGHSEDPDAYIGLVSLLCVCVGPGRAPHTHETNRDSAS